MVSESRVAAFLALAALAQPAIGELRVDEGTNIAVDVSPDDAELAIDLLGSLWTLPVRGGDAVRLPTPGLIASRPRWSPDGGSLLFQAIDAPGQALWTIDVASGEFERVTPPDAGAQHGSWHPSGDRIVYSAETRDSGLDLWERDLETGLAWRLTDEPGDESDAAWSADGRHLLYVHADGAHWQLRVRRFGHPARTVAEAEAPILAPSWRPDNTLVTYYADDATKGIALRIVILSDPPLDRELAAGADFFAAPPAWPDRTRFYYTADGGIRVRAFESREARRIPFSAPIAEPRRRDELTGRERPLPDDPETTGPVVLRAARLYDGASRDYRRNVDVLVADGRIQAIEAHRDREGFIVVDIGDVTLMPGLIDVYAGLEKPDDATRMALLANGVTTVVTPDLEAQALPDAPLDGPSPRILLAASATRPPSRAARQRVRLVTATPGGGRQGASHAEAWRRAGVPLLADSWVAGLAGGADFLLGTVTLPASPAGRRYGDLATLMEDGPLVLVSGLADSATPGLDMLLQTPASRLTPAPSPRRRHVAAPALANGGANVVVGSRPSGLAPGLATQAELLALSAAGLPNHAVLHAATGGAADALGLADELGRVLPGRRADLLLVAGDPLKNLADIHRVVGIVVGGRFSSVAGLLDRFAASD